MANPTARCDHSEKWIVDPPEGKHLRICTGCANRLIECTFCDAKIPAGHPDIGEWAKGGVEKDGKIVERWTACPNCTDRGYGLNEWWESRCPIRRMHGGKLP